MTLGLAQNARTTLPESKINEIQISGSEDWRRSFNGKTTQIATNEFELVLLLSLNDCGPTFVIMSCSSEQKDQSWEVPTHP